MGQIFQDDGTVIPVTSIQAGPCFVTQIKTQDKDGYNAVQVGYGEKKEKNVKKPQREMIKKIIQINSQIKYPRWLREFKTNENDKYKVGDIINLGIFKEGDLVNVSSRSKGKGFQGVVKRHNFKCGPASHGHKDQLRMPGSIGATGPAHVFKGTKMAGRTGGNKITVKNLEIIKIDKDNNLLKVKGAIPGHRNSLVTIVAS